ncbi:hypothetical protein FIBSPDRAFT_98945 [Athelia psychrophila]|uniref:Uncharacterized protein n=1 Tax=Athelia psychrophila TaxID=1759441 RepID=A0A166DRH8_9AGAM|nr:hypothetical protein FIBSPDRAFT_98945 [Fibularhizoctonia sp. CBS 109695]
MVAAIRRRKDVCLRVAPRMWTTSRRWPLWQLAANNSICIHLRHAVCVVLQPRRSGRRTEDHRGQVAVRRSIVFLFRQHKNYHHHHHHRDCPGRNHLDPTAKFTTPKRAHPHPVPTPMPSPHACSPGPHPHPTPSLHTRWPVSTHAGQSRLVTVHVPVQISKHIVITTTYTTLPLLRATTIYWEM